MSNGLIRAIADNALTEADELEAQADKMEADAKDNRKRAQVLRALHAIAAPAARSGDEPQPLRVA